MIQLKAGSKAPDFKGIDQQGNEIKLSGLRGKKVILFFYPADDTPTCTTEACNLRDNYDVLLKRGFIVLGVSPDSEKSHKSYANKYSLQFPIISDTSKEIINNYGVWGEKTLFGRKYLGVIRTTFIIDEKGLIEKIISNVNSSGHAEQILNLYNQ
jgi:thioredoxin-dependent peroxiredoxin